MIPMHHVPEELLFEYASGSSSEAVSLLVATHLSLCPDCRSEVARLEALGGGLLEDLEPASLDRGSFDALSARLDALEPSECKGAPTRQERSHPQSAAARDQKPRNATLPQPLRFYTGDFEKLPWKTLFPGVRQATLPLSHRGMPVRLSMIRGGMWVPRHTHEGREMNLVLAGGFSDGPDSFARGDVTVRDDQVVHSLWIDPGESCIILAVNEAPLIPVGFVSKLIGKVLHF